MVERVAVNHQVGGSSPSSGAKMLLGHQVREHFYFMGKNESLSRRMRGLLRSKKTLKKCGVFLYIKV